MCCAYDECPNNNLQVYVNKVKHLCDEIMCELEEFVTLTCIMLRTRAVITSKDNSIHEVAITPTIDSYVLKSQCTKSEIFYSKLYTICLNFWQGRELLGHDVVVN